MLLMKQELLHAVILAVRKTITKTNSHNFEKKNYQTNFLYTL